MGRLCAIVGNGLCTIIILDKRQGQIKMKSKDDLEASNRLKAHAGSQLHVMCCCRELTGGLHSRCGSENQTLKVNCRENHVS